MKSYFLENQKSIPPLTFNNKDVKKCPHQKHLGTILDSKLVLIFMLITKLKSVRK